MLDNEAHPRPVYPETVRRRLLKGFGAYSIGQVINLALRVLLPPLFLKAWGADLYGEWLVLSAFVAYLSLTDMGGQMYIVNRLTQAYAQQDIPLFRQILHTGLAIFLLVPTAVFLLFTTAISIIPPDWFLPISNTGNQIVVWVLAILAFQFVFSLPQGILLGIYRAVGLLPRGEMLGNLILLLQLILMAVALWLGGGMVWIAALQAVPYPLVAIIAAWELSKRFPQFGLLSLKEATYSMGLTFIRPSMHFLSIQVAQTFSIQGMVLVVGAILSPLQVVIFSTTRTVVAAMRQMLGLIVHAARPEMTRLDAEQSIDGLHILFRAVLRSTLIVAAVLVTIFHFFGGSIYHLWLGDTVEYQPAIMNLFLVYFVQLVFWHTCSQLLMAINVHHALSKMLLISSVLTITFAYLGGEYFGLRGVLIGMIAGDILLPFWYVPYLVGRYQARFSLMFFTKELAPIIGGVASLVVFPWAMPVVFVLLLIWWVSSIRPMAVLESSTDARPQQLRRS
jgi:O-antigen/teichoic acid export membrane protein